MMVVVCDIAYDRHGDPSRESRVSRRSLKLPCPRGRAVGAYGVPRRGLCPCRPWCSPRGHKDAARGWTLTVCVRTKLFLLLCWAVAHQQEGGVASIEVRTASGKHSPDQGLARHREEAELSQHQGQLILLSQPVFDHSFPWVYLSTPGLGLLETRRTVAVDQPGRPNASELLDPIPPCLRKIRHDKLLRSSPRHR